MNYIARGTHGRSPGLGGSLPGETLRRVSSGKSLIHLIGVRPILVLGAVTGVAEGLAAAFMFTHVRLLTRVRPKMSLQVFKT